MAKDFFGYKAHKPEGEAPSRADAHVAARNREYWEEAQKRSASCFAHFDCRLIERLTRFGGQVIWEQHQINEPSEAWFEHSGNFYLRTRFATYSVTLRAPDANGPSGYLGCVATLNNPYPGETWRRGRDLADGDYTDTTWMKIVTDIAAFELERAISEEAYTESVEAHVGEQPGRAAQAEEENAVVGDHNVVVSLAMPPPGAVDHNGDSFSAEAHASLTKALADVKGTDTALIIHGDGKVTHERAAGVSANFAVAYGGVHEQLRRAVEALVANGEDLYVTYHDPLCPSMKRFESISGSFMMGVVGLDKRPENQPQPPDL